MLFEVIYGVAAVLSGAALLLGGYYVFKAFLAAFGSLVGAPLGFVIALLIDNTNGTILIIGTIVAGVAFAIASYYLYWVFLFLWGAAVGFGIGYFVSNELFDIGGGFGILISTLTTIALAILAVWAARWVIIITTSMFGAMVITTWLLNIFDRVPDFPLPAVWPIDDSFYTTLLAYFRDQVPVYISDNLFTDLTFLLVGVALFVTGIFLQSRIIPKKLDSSNEGSLDYDYDFDDF